MNLVSAHHNAHFVWCNLDTNARDSFIAVLRGIVEAEDLFRLILVLAE